MKYASAFSGIGTDAIAWHDLGWQCAWFAETDKFPCEVLRQRFPDVPNLGDVTEIGGEHGPVDLLVGGPPCQDFSVAGKRKGMDGARGNMTLEFLALAKRLRARWIVFENVPGILSSNGGKDIQEVLDVLTQMGYVSDIDILDAQYFGLAQRRRRVFITCVRLEDLLQKKTSISERIIAELLVQALQSTWGAIQQVSSQGRSPSEYAHQIEKSVAFLKKRMSLLSALLGGSAVTKLLENLAADRHPCMDVQQNSASTSRRVNEKHIEDSSKDIGGSLLRWMAGASGDQSIESSWSNILDDLYQAVSISTISILTSRITESKICTFAQAVGSTMLTATGHHDQGRKKYASSHLYTCRSVAFCTPHKLQASAAKCHVAPQGACPYSACSISSNDDRWTISLTMALTSR